MTLEEAKNYQLKILNDTGTRQLMSLAMQKNNLLVVQVIEQGVYNYRRQRNTHDRRMSLLAREALINSERGTQEEV